MALVVKSSGATGELLSAIRRIMFWNSTRPSPSTTSSHWTMCLAHRRHGDRSCWGSSMAAARNHPDARRHRLVWRDGLPDRVAGARLRRPRLALGAPPSRIATLVATRALVLTASGIAGGLVLHALLAPFLRAFLFGRAPPIPRPWPARRWPCCAPRRWRAGFPRGAPRASIRRARCAPSRRHEPAVRPPGGWLHCGDTRHAPSLRGYVSLSSCCPSRSLPAPGARREPEPVVPVDDGIASTLVAEAFVTSLTATTSIPSPPGSRPKAACG